MPFWLTPRRLLPLLLLIVIVLAGATWYGWIEEFGFFDGLYMAVITLTTVGYEEVRPLDESGRGFTIVYTLAGIGVLFYVAGGIVEELVAGTIADALGTHRFSRRAQRMRDHVIVCGQGRVGREVVRLLREGDIPTLAIDWSEERLDFARSLGAIPLLGDATEQALLERAHAERARALIAAADSDAVNTYIVLTARTINPEVEIVARAASDEAVSRLGAAGASRVFSPYQIAGRHMAIAATDPHVIEFIDTLDSPAQQGPRRLVAQISIGHGAEEGRSLADLFSVGDVQLIATVQAGGELIFSPPEGTVPASGDRLMVYGEESAIRRFAERHRT